MGEALPFGSRGGMAARHYFPLDAEYVFKVRVPKGVKVAAHSVNGEVRVDDVSSDPAFFAGGTLRLDRAAALRRVGGAVPGTVSFPGLTA